VARKEKGGGLFKKKGGEPRVARSGGKREKGPQRQEAVQKSGSYTVCLIPTKEISAVKAAKREKKGGRP